MAAATELNFALASFWEFARIWKAGKSCKLILSCDLGRGEVQVVAGLGAADEPHLPLQDFQAQKYGRKKTPSQLRREERRRKERKAAKAKQDELIALNSGLLADQARQKDDIVNVNVEAEAEEALNTNRDTTAEETPLNDPKI